MIVLRPYQSVIINNLRTAFRTSHRAPLLVAPTGSGKTVCFSYMAATMAAHNKRILILVHREELIEQVSRTLQEFNVPHSFIAVERLYAPTTLVQVASVFSLARRLDRVPPPHLIIIDECHHAITGSTWGRILAAFPKVLRIGVTATPLRLSGEGLSSSFDTLVRGPSVRDLIDSGDLSPFRIFAPPSVDLSTVHRRMGDFVSSELLRLVDKPTVTGDVVAHYRKLAHDKRAVVFCVSIHHAEHVAQQFQAAGYRAASVDGRMNRGARRAIVQSFVTGNLDVLTSCDLVSEGFDLPAIEVAILLRPTMSLGLHLQQVGRVLRPYPGKDAAIILDHAGNTLRHGLPDDSHEWTLNGRSHRSNGTNMPSVRVCASCFAAQFAGALRCQFCGYVFEVTPREVVEREGELEEVTQLRRVKKQEQGRARTLAELVALGRARGYRNPTGWAICIVRARRS